MTRPGRGRSRAVATARAGPPSVLRRLRIRLLPAPGQAAGLALLAAVLTAALVSPPLFTASAEAGAWDREQDRLGEVALGATLLSTTVSRRGEVVPERIRAVDDLDAGVREAGRAVGLGTPELRTDLRNDLVGTVVAGSGVVDVVSLPDGARNVEIVAGRASGDGVLVPEPLADRAAFGPGTTITLTGPNGTVVLPVSGVYVAPVAPLPEFWDGLGHLFLPRLDRWTGEPVDPPAAVLAPQELALGAAVALREDLDLVWSLPLDGSLGIDGARATAERFEALQAALLDPGGPVAGVVADADFGSAIVRTALPDAFAAVDRTAGLLTPPVRTVGIGGAAAALVLVGAWAGHRVRRRDDELRLLVARGLSPLRAAGDGVREAVLPVLVGVLAGGVLAGLLVRGLGPSDRLPSVTTGAAVTAALLGLAAALLVVGAVTAVLVTGLYRVGRGRAAALLGRVPWLAVVTAVTVLTALPVLTGSRSGGGRVDVLTLALPLLVTVVAAGAVTGLLPRLGRWADARLRRLPPGPYLALRRVLAAQGTTRLVVVTTALTLGLVVHAGALASSTDRTLAATLAVATGSDVVVPVPRGRVVEPPLWEDAMVVGTATGATVLPGETQADVLVVRPGEVAGVVRWDEALAERPLEELMAALAGYDGDRVPVVLSGGLPDGVAEGAGDGLVLDLGSFDLPVEVVARADAFPGQSATHPLLVADRDRFTATLEAAGRDPGLVLGQEVWSRGDARTVADLLPSVGVELPDEGVGSAESFAARPELAAQVWSLDYLRAVALAAGALGLAGLVVHAVAQQRRRTAAALLLTRMGMSRRSSDAAAGLEVGLLAGVAALVAVAVALPASALVLQLLDPVPDVRPDALFRVPWGTIATILAGVVLVTVGGALLVGRSARRASGGQVMRDGS